MTDAKHQRCAEVNEAIRIIGSHGRRFFYNAKFDRFSYCEVDKRGRVWFVDDYTWCRVYTHKTGFGNKWSLFSHGGTLRDLVEAFRDYICTGDPMSRGWLGPERSWSDGNVWGYAPEEMAKVRELAGALPCFRPPRQEAA